MKKIILLLTILLLIGCATNDHYIYVFEGKVKKVEYIGNNEDNEKTVLYFTNLTRILNSHKNVPLDKYIYLYLPKDSVYGNEIIFSYKLIKMDEGYFVKE
jgi:hypothetical protein